MNRHERRGRERETGIPRLLRRAARRALASNQRPTRSEDVARVVRAMRRDLHGG